MLICLSILVRNNLQEILKLSKSENDLPENLFPLNLYSPSLPQSRLAWVPPSTQLHSGLAPSTHLCNNLLGRPASSQTFLHGRRSSLSRSDRNWHDHENDHNLRPTQSTLRPSAVWFCHRVCVLCLSAFLLQHESRCVERLSISACRVKCVDGVCRL